MSKPVRVALVPTLAAVTLVGGIFIGRASADQPHMHAALDALRLAKKELEIAEADKGGHRGRAIKLTEDAIIQVEKGIEFARH